MHASARRRTTPATGYLGSPASTSSRTTTTSTTRGATAYPTLGLTLTTDPNPDPGPRLNRDHHLTVTRFNCCYGNIGWCDALHGTDTMYRDYKRKKAEERAQAQAQWEAKVAELRSLSAQT